MLVKFWSAGWSLKKYKVVLPGEDLGVFGGWRGREEVQVCESITKTALVQRIQLMSQNGEFIGEFVCDESGSRVDDTRGGEMADPFCT